MEHGDLLTLLPEVQGRRVLDLGCGAGQLAHHLAHHLSTALVRFQPAPRVRQLDRTVLP